MCELWLQLDRTAKRLDCLLMLRLKMESEPEVNVSLGDRRRSFKELPEPGLRFRVRATLSERSAHAANRDRFASELSRPVSAEGLRPEPQPSIQK